MLERCKSSLRKRDATTATRHLDLYRQTAPSLTCSDVASDNTPFSNTSASGSYGRFLMMRFAVALPIPGTSINSSRLAVFRTSAFSFGVGHSLGWIPKAYNIGAVRQEEESPCKPTASKRRLRFRLLRSSCLIFAHTSVFESRILRASSSSAKASSAARAPEFGAVGQAGNHRCQPYSGITTSTSRCLGCRFPEISWTANVKVRR
jgi:hypothetical protein